MQGSYACRHGKFLWGLAATSFVLVHLTFLAHADEAQPTLEIAKAETCMVDVLKTVPGFLEAHLVGHPNDSKLMVLAYSLRYPAGRVFHRRVELYEDGPTNFSIYMTEGLTPTLRDDWRKCGVKMVLDLTQ